MSPWQIREASFQQTVPGEADPRASTPGFYQEHLVPLCTLDLPVTCPLPPQDSQFPSAEVGGEESGGNNDHC